MNWETGRKTYYRGTDGQAHKSYTCSGGGLIIDCLKHVTPDDPSEEDCSGLYYEPPKPLEKKFFPLMEERVVEALNNEFERGAPLRAGYTARWAASQRLAGEVCCRAERIRYGSRRRQSRSSPG